MTTASAVEVVQGGVSKAIVMKLCTEIHTALTLPAVKEKLAGYGYEPVGGTPEQFDAVVRKEVVKWADVVKRTGAKAD